MWWCTLGEGGLNLRTYPPWPSSVSFISSLESKMARILLGLKSSLNHTIESSVAAAQNR